MAYINQFLNWSVRRYNDLFALNRSSFWIITDKCLLSAPRRRRSVTGRATWVSTLGLCALLANLDCRHSKYSNASILRDMSVVKVILYSDDIRNHRWESGKSDDRVNSFSLWIQYKSSAIGVELKKILLKFQLSGYSLSCKKMFFLSLKWHFIKSELDKVIFFLTWNNVVFSYATV